MLNYLKKKKKKKIIKDKNSVNYAQVISSYTKINVSLNVQRNSQKLTRHA